MDLNTLIVFISSSADPRLLGTATCVKRSLSGLSTQPEFNKDAACGLKQALDGNANAGVAPGEALVFQPLGIGALHWLPPSAQRGAVGRGRAASNSSAAAPLSMPQPSGRCRKVASVCIVSAGRCPEPSSRAGSSQATALVTSSRTVPFNAARHRHDRVRSTQGGSENHPQVTLSSSYRLLDFV